MLTVIVTRNPNTNILYKNIIAIKNITNSKILIIDNASSIDLSKIRKLCDYFVQNNTNEGLAKAYNYAIKIASYLNEDWILLLDQDTEIYENLDIQKIFDEYNKLPIMGKVAIISLNRIYAHTTKNEIGNFKLCKSVVNSGSILNVKICSRFRYNEDLFIDRIDNDYCSRLRKNGFYILVYRYQLIYHSIGDYSRLYNKQISKIIIFLLKILSIRHGIREFKKVMHYRAFYVVYNNYYRYYTIIRNTVYLCSRGKIDLFYLKTLPSWVLSLYEQTNLIITLKLVSLALFHGILGDLKNDNKKLIKLF